ncbi:MAG: hypothetical protein A2252_07075 [Elusimicrobia bacterium RIFOXYA2_FULL_39_19]|nr:MAG: hypothetical protein A2252_07075 [Elusimicrobia bacterium RIFOXYA2_FULL_39_19]
MKKHNIIFLHHSTGNVIWKGGVPEWFASYNASNKTDIKITEQAFPKKVPYGWKNYPYDYWKIWVKNAGNMPYLEEPTLEMLTKEYDVIIFKHCFPVTDVEADTGTPDITSNEMTLENFKLQYNALKQKLHQFPGTTFILWTGPAQVKNETNEENAKRAKIFFDWVKNTWNENNDNIYLWDFYELETERGLYLKEEYAAASDDSHPNELFAKKACPLFCQRIIDVISGKGAQTNLTGRP